MIGAQPLTLEPLGAVSPSLAEALDVCPLRAALRHCVATGRLRRVTPPLALGRAAHLVVEAALMRRFPEGATARSQLEAIWQEAIGQSATEMREQAPFGSPPAAERWPGYQRVRVRTLRMAERILVERPQSEQEESRRSGTSTAVMRVERSLVSRDGAVMGRPDRIEQRNGGSEVIDLKTGRRSEDAMTPAERRQLLFYAYLWHDETGSWPVRASIETGDGKRLDIVVDQHEAETVVRSAVASRDSVNARIAAGADPASLAKVDPVHCQRCCFRVACGPYWSAATTDDDRFLRDAKGVVAAVDDVGGAILSSVVGSVTSEHVRVRGLVERIGEKDLGRVIALQDLSSASGDAELMTNWQSDYWWWD